jgi:hypothetical protein
MLLLKQQGVVNPQTGGPFLVGCPQLLIQYICSYPPYVEAIPYIHNLMHHAMVTRGPFNMEGTNCKVSILVSVCLFHIRYAGTQQLYSNMHEMCIHQILEKKKKSVTDFKKRYNSVEKYCMTFSLNLVYP